MDYQGQEALDIMHELDAFRDGVISELRVFDVDGVRVGAELVCVPRTSSSVAKTTLRFEGLSEFAIYWSGKYEIGLITNYKGLLLETGQAYISTDPYDAAEVATIPDERDNEVFVAEKLIVTLTMK